MEYRLDPRLNASALKCFAGSDLEFSQRQAAYRMQNFKSSKAMELGSAVHHAIEHIGQDVPMEVYEAFFQSLKTPASRKANAAVVPEILAAFVEQEPTLSLAVKQNPECCELARYTDKYKALADFYYNDHLFDWKVTNDVSFWGVRNSIKKFGYLIQAWLYCHVFGTRQFTFVFIENKPPYEVVRVPVSHDMLMLGEEQAKVAEARYNAWKSGEVDDERTYEFDFKPRGDEDVNLGF